MPDLPPNPAPEQLRREPAPMSPREPHLGGDVYRPISGWAIAGLSLSIVFAVWLLVDATVGLIRGMPFLLPTALLLLPAGGVLLSFIARWQIRDSLGTRAGMALTGWGIWLGALFGLGYFAYSMATVVAVKEQAKSFLLDENKGFFTKLKTPGEINVAFLLTRPPDLREGINPNNTTSMLALFKIHLTSFYGSNLVRIAQQGGKETEIRLLSVKTPVYKDGGYWVDVDAEIRSPYFLVQAPFVVRSQESKAGRQWFVDWTKTPSAAKDAWPSKRGHELQQLWVRSHRVALQWADRWSSDQLQPKDFVPKGDGLDLSKIRGVRMADTLRQAVARFADPSASDRPTMACGFYCCEAGPIVSKEAGPLQPYWEFNKAGHLEIGHELRIVVSGASKDLPTIICIARLIVERTDANAGSRKYDEKHPPSWRVVRLDMDRARAADSSQTQKPGKRRPK